MKNILVAMVFYLSQNTKQQPHNNHDNECKQKNSQVKRRRAKKNYNTRLNIKSLSLGRFAVMYYINSANGLNL